jgi:predicted ATP-grasp superfamily ATP-dependent carboligase
MDRRRETPDNGSGMAPVIVLGMSPVGLSLLRAFGRRRIPVAGVDSDPREVGFCSSFGRKRVVCSPEEEPAKLRQQLLGLARRWRRPAVLLPGGDPFVLYLARHAELLQQDFRFVTPGASLVEALEDKLALHRLLTAHGIPTPATVALRDGALDGDAPAFPCIAKSRFADRARARCKGFAVPTRDELGRVCADPRAAGAEMVLQEFVPGPDDQHYSCAAYLDRDGRVLGTFSARKLRQYPRTMGVGCLCESRRQPEVAALALGVLQAIGHRGIAEVEVKRDARTGRWAVIEINPRTWLQSELARRAGVDLDYLAYLDACGATTFPTFRQKDGIKWMQPRWDLLASAEAMLAGELSPAGWLRSLGGVKVVAFWDTRDLTPFAREVGQLFAGLAGAAGRRAGRLLGLRRR